MAEKLTDILAYVLALALAASVLAFAAYKVSALDGMEDPPANLGLNFPPLKRKVITDAPLGVDPLVTRSLRDAGEPAGRRSAGSIPFAYELLTVVDGVAFVAVNSADDKTLVPATIGTRLPGGLEVTSLRRRDGRWVLSAGNLSLEQALPSQ